MNKISVLFGNKSILASKMSMIKSVKSLKDLSFKIVSSGQVLKAILATSVARIKCCLTVKDWLQSATMPMKMHVNHLEEDFDLFCFPEFSEQRNQIEC